MYAGPHNKQANLSFGMDLGTPSTLSISGFNTKSRFFKGRPTVNYAPTDLGSWTVESGASRLTTNQRFRNQPVYW